jgi:TolB-like protein/Flp pilus assembly protein TadD
MATAQRDGQALREELERVLSSACFARSERVSKLLRFLVERQLEGRESELKESSIGVEVFGRRPDYDPKLDSTVRTEAVRLRARLSKYYSTEGRQNPLVIEVPKGGYVPSFREPEAAPVVPRTSPKRLWLAAGWAGFALAAAALGAWVLHQNAPIQIAVLPLVNLSQDPAEEYLADGLTSEIIRNLSIIDGLAVRSQTSSFALKGKPTNVREAGQQLQADYIVEGSVLRDGPRVRISAQLVRASDDHPVWSSKFEREWTDVISIQDEISRGIVNSLRLKLGRGQRRYETSAEAYDLYLHARAAGALRFPGDPEVTDMFEKAIAKDPSLAPAQAGLAAAYAWRSAESPRGAARDEALEKMQAPAQKAIQLDPLLAEAHSALGMVYARNGQWDAAERSFRRAVAIEPNLSFAHEALGRFFLWPLGRIDEAVREMRAAERNDPMSPQAHYELADALLSAGRFKEAARQCEKLPADSVWKNECLGRARVAQGRIAEAVPLLAASPTFNWGYLAYAYARAGRRAEAEKLMDEGPKLYPNRRGAFQFALAYAGFGDKDQTIGRLERMVGVGAVRIGYTLNSPEFAFVRGDPRVKALCKQVGLPE